MTDISVQFSFLGHYDNGETMTVRQYRLDYMTFTSDGGIGGLISLSKILETNRIALFIFQHFYVELFKKL